MGGRTNLTPGKRMFYSKIGEVTCRTFFFMVKIYSTFSSVGLNGEPEIIKLVCCEAAFTPQDYTFRI